MTNSSGNTAGAYQFDAYGNTTAHTGTSTPMQYAGQYLDSESGLYWMRARYYDPSTGQFVSRDPIVAITGEAYGYVSGDPTNMSDPLGLWGWKNVKKWVGDHGMQAVAVVAVVGATACALSVACGVAVVGAISTVAPSAGTAILAGAAGAGCLGRAASLVGAAPKAAKTTQNSATFVGEVKGPSTIIPKGAQGPFPVENGNGVQFVGGQGGNGLANNVTDVRIMDPIGGKFPQPSGYVSYSNNAVPTPQTVNPFSGKTVPSSDPSWPQDELRPKDVNVALACRASVSVVTMNQRFRGAESNGESASSRGKDRTE